MSRNIFGSVGAIASLISMTSSSGVAAFGVNPKKFGAFNLIVVDASATDGRIPSLPDATPGSDYMLAILHADKAKESREIAVGDITLSVGGILNFDVPHFEISGNERKVFCLDQPAELSRLMSALKGPAVVPRRLINSALATDAGSVAATDAAVAARRYRPAAAVEDPVTVHIRSLTTYLSAQMGRMRNTGKGRVLQNAVEQASRARSVDEVKAIVRDIVRPEVSKHRNPVSNFFTSIISHPLSRRELDKVFNAEDVLIKPAPRP